MNNGLQRFIDAQNENNGGKSIAEIALEEIKKFKKESHWIWFIFPQIKGLGTTQNSIKYAIADREEAALYLSHPILGTRLIEITQAALDGAETHSALEIFGETDAKKFLSSMTLFSTSNPEVKVFREALELFFEGKVDTKTIQLLDEASLS
jgi:uncharacterized protein (DUF1810 family)